MNDNDVRVAGAFLLGGLLGAAVALLYAPQSGRETRRDIAKTAKKVKKEASELVEETIESVNDFVGDVKSKASQIIDRGVEISEGAKKELVRSLEQSQKIIEKQKTRIVEGLGL